MFFDLILTKWKESLDIFKKDELKVYLLASLNTFKRSFLIFSKLVGLYYLLFMGIVLTLSYFLKLDNNIIKHTVYLILSVFLFIIFLIIRPSLEDKNYLYLAKYKNYLLGFLLSYFVFNNIFILFALIAIFFLDSDNSLESFIHSIISGFKFICYNFPTVLILVGFNFLLNLIVGKFNLSLIYFILYPILNILFLSFLIIFYIRIKHKDYNLFYK